MQATSLKGITGRVETFKESGVREHLDVFWTLVTDSETEPPVIPCNLFILLLKF